ncbi:hypothetical protein N2152v2_007068 [Parachlorella kessleri]
MALQGDRQEVVQYLTQLLEQLEGARGGVDVEARQKLELLKAQLQVMESIQQGTGPGPGPPLVTEVAVAKELDSLDTRLTKLEHRLEDLDENARLVVQQSVAGWVGAEAQPDMNSSSQPGKT